MLSEERKRKNEEEEIETGSQAHVDEGKVSDEGPASKKRTKSTEEHALNTNVSVLKSLKWQPHRCIRELLLNCTDEDPNATVEQVDEHTWKFKNAVEAGKSSLRKENFAYASNKEKVEDRLKNGKFGYGLKDAVVLLTAHGIQYVARSVNGSFTARANEDGAVSVTIDPSDGVTDGVEQILSIGDGKVSPEILKEQIEAAQNQCIVFRVRGEFKGYEAVEVWDRRTKSATPLGTVYIPPANPQVGIGHTGTTELFVHGCAYPFCCEDERLRLALIYNLHIDKSAIEGRDRANGLPLKWEPALRVLVKEATEPVLDRLVQLRKLHSQKFYEFNNQFINKYLNAHVDVQGERSRRIQKEAERAEKDAEEAVKAQAEAQQEALLTSQSLERMQTEDVPTEVVLMLQEELVQRQEEERLAATRAQQALAVAVDKRKEAECIAQSTAPTVLMLPGCEMVPPNQNVEPLHIKSTNDPKWAASEVPSSEEYNLMATCRPPIDRMYTPLFRQLRRLLYAMGLQDKVDIDRLDSSASATALAKLHDTTLRVRFDDDTAAAKMNVLRVAIQELSSAGLFSELIGCSTVEAIAQVANLMLQLTPEDPTELRNRSSAVLPKFLGQFHFPAPAKPFCPLLVATEWDTKFGGISSFNIQLAKGLAAELVRAGGSGSNAEPVLFIVVLGTDKISTETLTEWNDAAKIGIKIVSRSRCSGVFTPALTSGEFARITHIVGHAHITGEAASQMRKLQQLHHAKLWQINHVLPLLVDPIKEDGTAQSRYGSAREKNELLKKLNADADHVFSVGAMMYEHFEKQLSRRGRPPGTKHMELILPLNPDFLKFPTEKDDFPDRGGKIEVLFFGRVDSAQMVKGVDIAMNAVEKANKSRILAASERQIVLKVRGAKISTEAATYGRLIATQKAEHRDIAPSVAPFASPAEVIGDLQEAHMVIMPSRIEPFGLVAMEAIACGVPVLVSNNSGVARLLRDNGAEKRCVQTSVHNAKESSSSALQADIDAWSQAILELIAERSDAFKRAKKLAAALEKEIPVPYTRMIELGGGCASAPSNAASVATPKKQKATSSAVVESKSDA